MRSSGSSWGLRLAIVSALLAPACSISENTVAIPAVQEKATIPASPANAMRYSLFQAERRVRDLEARLADKEREIAAAKGEIDGLREREKEARLGRDAGEAVGAQLAETAQESARVQPGSPPQSAAPEPPPADGGAANGGATATGEPEPGSTSQQLTWLHSQLTLERQQRQALEAELIQLQEETSAGPFENKLQSDLKDAKMEIEKLKATLEIERRAHQDLERRYADLRAQIEAAAATGSNDSIGPRAEEIAALKERQRRVLAGIQRDLAASRQHEQELRDALSQTQGEDAIQLADAIAGLQIENAALRLRLDEEHRNNGELSAKLNLASRVTDLIFRMQTRDGDRNPTPGAQAEWPVGGL